MKKYSLAAIAGAAILSVVPASASSTTFQFSVNAPTTQNGTGFGDNMVFDSAVANATVFAYSNATNTSTTGTTFQTGQLGQSINGVNGTDNGGPSNNPTMPLGLTDCNQNEGTGCGSPNHQVDNSTGYDFVLIEFSAKVNLDSITLSTYQGNSNGTDSQDFSYITGSGAFPSISSLGTTTLSSVLGTNGASMTSVSCTTAGFDTTALDKCNTGASNTYTPSLPAGGSFGGNGVTWLLVGASYPDASNLTNFDGFKISDLAIDNTTVTGTPEPATFGLIGLALAGLGVYGRKRKSSNS